MPAPPRFSSSSRSDFISAMADRFSLCSTYINPSSSTSVSALNPSFNFFLCSPSPSGIGSSGWFLVFQLL
uniref:Uncharacterized protein n=1 Tax=Arundo donax TaxID=35708 RepID=A0A0A9E3D8_ARUDO